MNKIHKLFTKDMLINYVFIFYIISIILDLHIFYNSISTFIRVVIISILFLIIFFKYATKKERKYLILYFTLLFIYILFHLWNANNFNVEFVKNYSTLKELLYFLKMSMNVLLLFIIYKLNMNKNKFYQIITISAFFISLSIIIANIFKIGYTSYDFNLPSFNIFDWFKITYIDFATASTKGYFHLTNQISAILILYLPILLLHLKENKKPFTFITIILLIISLFMLGTRISSYSTIIILIMSTIIYLITSLINDDFKVKYFLSLFIFLIISLGLYNNCPLLSRNLYYDELFNVKEEEKEEYIETIDPTRPLSDYSLEELKLYLKNFNISDGFYNIYYPVQYDREFYENYVSMNTTKINDTRFLELNVIKRVKELNNNSLDTYLGLGYNRVINIFNIESDYTMQYYSLGIIGLILVLGVNIFILIYMYFKTLFNLKRYLTYNNIMLIFSISYVLLSAYFTGNILNAISCNIPISFGLGYALGEINKKNENTYEYYLGLKTTTKTKEEVLDDIFKDKKQAIIYNINPIIAMNLRKNKEFKLEINKSDYNIPDGNGIVLASLLTSNNIRNAIPGIDLMDSILKRGEKKNYKVYFYGSKEDSLKKSIKLFKNKYKKLNIVGYRDGYNKNKEEDLKDILKRKPDILFVSLGSPLQEEFIIKNKDKLKDIKIIMPIGGSLDVYSGNLKRAPKIMQKLKLEWLYRMIQEPKRFKQIFTMIGFIILVLFGSFWYKENE